MTIVTLTTDFGLSDAFAGVMKGVMLGINRDIAFVDLTHDIAPQNVRQAAYALYSAVGYFPEGTVHLCVVDPGVGSGRRALVFEAGGSCFVGPDNGVFTKIMGGFKPDNIYAITNPDFMADDVSRTFHGRDVFAPAAAWLAKGNVPPSAFGPPVADPVTLELPSPSQSAPNIIEGEVIYVDHFGNAITNVPLALMEKAERDAGAAGVEVETHAGVAAGVLSSYWEAPDDKSLNAIISSWNTLEIFTRSGSASAIHGLTVGDRVEVRYY